MTIRVLDQKGTPKREIARTLGVSEGLVRYHLKRDAEGAMDGRKLRRLAAESVAAQVDAFAAGHRHDERPLNVRVLHEHLIQTVGYESSEAAYRRLLRFVRARYPKPRMRTFRRVETPPGAQTQTDWGEFPRVDVGDGPEPLHAFVMSLSHSRYTAIVWSRRENLVSWLSCHNGAYRRLGGVAAVNRIDNVKTAIVRGAGANGDIHPVYSAYARAMRFHVDACQPRQAWAKGKAEAKVKLSRVIKELVGAHHASLEELQADTDAALSDWSRRALCPVTGDTVHDTWQAEIERLGALPETLPEPFDVCVRREVKRDGIVHFEGRSYAAPAALAGLEVDVRGCAAKVQIVYAGVVVREWPRHTKERLLIDPALYDFDSDRVIPPPPLGRMGKRLQEIWEMPVESRPIDLYAALAEVAR